MTAAISVDDVFINCPFDDEFQPIFRAITFTVFACGFRLRTALELDDGLYPRLDKILNMIGECALGIHDLSRTELDSINNLPRFNMPFEFGIFVGAKRFGSEIQEKKRALVPAEKGLVFYGSQKNKLAIYEQIQYTLFVTFQTVKLELIEITILDFSIDNSFSSLLNLADCLKISKITDIKAFHDFVDTLRQNAIRINHDILIDDNAEVRKNWEHKGGIAIDPTNTNLFVELSKLIS